MTDDVIGGHVGCQDAHYNCNYARGGVWLYRTPPAPLLSEVFSTRFLFMSRYLLLYTVKADVVQ